MWPDCYAVHSNRGSDCVTGDVSELPDQISSPKQLDPNPQTQELTESVPNSSLVRVLMSAPQISVNTDQDVVDVDTYKEVRW